jgi:hypothetical protein
LLRRRVSRGVEGRDGAGTYSDRTGADVERELLEWLVHGLVELFERRLGEHDEGAP